MRTILQINYCKLLLPDNAPVTQLLKVLGDSKLLEYGGRAKENDKHTTYKLQGKPTVEIELVNSENIVTEAEWKKIEDAIKAKAAAAKPTRKKRS